MHMILSRCAHSQVHNSSLLDAVMQFRECLVHSLPASGHPTGPAMSPSEKISHPGVDGLSGRGFDCVMGRFFFLPPPLCVMLINDGIRS